MGTWSLSSDTPEEGIRPHYGWLWATLWSLGIKLKTSGRSVSALNHWAISPALPSEQFKGSYCMEMSHPSRLFTSHITSQNCFLKIWRRLESQKPPSMLECWETWLKEPMGLWPNSLQLVPLARKIFHLCYAVFAGFCTAVLASCSFLQWKRIYKRSWVESIYCEFKKRWQGKTFLSSIKDAHIFIHLLA